MLQGACIELIGLFHCKQLLSVARNNGDENKREKKKNNKVVGPLKQSISHKLVKGSAGPESAANSYTVHLKSHIMQKAEQNKKKPH